MTKLVQNTINEYILNHKQLNKCTFNESIDSILNDNLLFQFIMDRVAYTMKTTDKLKKYMGGLKNETN